MADGTISETLRLTDAFTQTFRSFNDWGEKSVRTLEQMGQGLTEVMNVNAGATLAALREIHSTLQQTNELIKGNAESQDRHTQETRKTDNAMQGLLSTVKSLAIAAAGVKFAKDFIGLSDTMSSINARIGNINDGMQTTAQLTDMIYRSAQRSRASYEATAASIAQMGANAGKAFSSNRELITFMELINKQFVLSGTDANLAQSAMLQLSQAMAAGALRGQDLNSILQAAPAIARRIESSMGWAEGSIKQYAEKGAVTAEVVKNAMLGSAEDINAAFAKMPMTVGQIMTQIKNAVTMSLSDAAASFSEFLSSDTGSQIVTELINGFTLLAEVGVGALQAIGQVALWVHDNIGQIIPILLAVIAVMIAYKAEAIAAGIASFIAGIQAFQAWALAHIPLLLIIGLLAIVLMAAIQTGLTFAQVGQFIGQILGMIFAVGYNVFATLWDVIASFAEFFANVFVNPVQAVVHLFSNALDAILSMVETVAGAIDALMGSNLSGAVSGFRGKLSSWVDSTFGEQAVEIKRMANLDVAATSQSWGDAGAKLGGKLDNLGTSLTDFSAGFGDLTAGLNLGGAGMGGGDVPNVGKVGSVGKVEGDVKLSDEDLKMYRDLAEQRYMNNIELQTLAPAITVNLPEGAGQNLSAEDVAERIRVMLAEQRAAHTATAHG